MEQIRMLIWEAAVVIGALLRPAAKSIRENSGLAVLSIVLAFGLWIFVTDAENPEQTKVLPVDIPVRPVNRPSDVAVADTLGNVRVRIRVEENVFDSLTKDDFQATVDLDGLTVGTYERPVDVRTLTGRGNLRVIEVLPDKVPVKLDQLISKPVPIELETRNAPPPDFELSH